MKMTFMIISFVKMDDIKLNILSVLKGYLCNCKLLYIRKRYSDAMCNQMAVRIRITKLSYILS